MRTTVSGSVKMSPACVSVKNYYVENSWQLPLLLDNYFLSDSRGINFS